MNLRIREIRKDMKLTQGEFAKLLNVSENYIYMVESGKTPASDKFIFLLMKVTNINETWLRTGEGDMHAPETKAQKVAQITAQLFKDEDDSFRTRLISLISDMSVEELQMLETKLKKLFE